MNEKRNGHKKVTVYDKVFGYNKVTGERDT